MLLLLAACAEPSSTSPDDSSPVDLTAALGAQEVRAGQVTDEDVLIGGISAEGKAGDVLVYNDRVRFVVQAAGDSSYYVDYGGQLIDADLVRPDGEAGRDILDELGPMIGLGRLVDATSVEVVEDGSRGRAVVRVSGKAAPMRLLTGALENDAFVADLDLDVVTDYILLPDRWDLQVVTTVTNSDSADLIGNMGMVGIYAQEVADPVKPRDGLFPDSSDAAAWTGLLGRHDELALAVMGDQEDLEQGAVAQLLGSTAAAFSGFGPALQVAPGETASWTTRVALGPDLATITGAQRQWRNLGGRQIGGTVTAGGAPLPGARVWALDGDGGVVTAAHTDATGRWTAILPNEPLTFVATGRGHAEIVDLPPGHAWISPYDVHADTSIASLASGGPATAFAEGYGTSAASSAFDLTLTPPGAIEVTTDDGLPAVARVYFASGDPSAADARLVPDRPDGCAAIGWIRDGSLTLPVEPGDYTLVVHRGVRDEVSVTSLHVDSGQTVQQTVSVPRAYAPEGVLVGDPHVHAAPSGDAGIPMEDRLLTMAANGVDLHFGTDHDHVADYRPLLAPMALDGMLRSVVADEVSPVLRGHFNAWPARLDPATANHGAPRWWFGYADTTEIFGWIRALVGPDGIIQANHPVGSSGMFSYAGYDPSTGAVGAADHWSSDFQAMELVNSGDWADYLPFYLDLARRGRAVTPLGVSDTHTYTSGGIGLNVTFFHTGTDLAGFDDATLVAATRARETVASHGPYIDATIDGAWAPGRVVAGPASLSVVVDAPSWMPVETVSLYEDGFLVAQEPCVGSAPAWCTATWALAPDDDATYVVIAASVGSPMTWVHPGNLAWAATSAIRLDAQGDGWTAPYPDLTGI